MEMDETPVSSITRSPRLQSWVVHIVFLMIAISGIEAILLIPYGFRIICCMLIAALIIACIMILCPNNISTKSVLSRKGGVRP